MGELNRWGCNELADVAAELALGALTGRERANALAHIECCAACREHVRQLTVTAEELLELLPGVEPPRGFETRVMARTSPTGRNRGLGGRIRRVLAVAALTLAATVGGLSGWGLRAVLTSANSPLSSAVLVSASQQPAGKIFAYHGSPGWLYMTVDLPSARGTVICQVVGTDGHVAAVGSFWLADGYGSWGGPGPADTGPLAGARLISPGGAVLATASFPRH